MREALQQLVRTRAGDRCEYCRLRQEHTPFATFHIEHIRAKQHGGQTVAENLALACNRCNAFKGPNLTGVDPDTRSVVLLFNPRTDLWKSHFEFDGPLVVGLTSMGRATVNVLGMNEERRIHLRQKLIDNDEFE
jgi:hypothetical protein